MNTQEDNIVSQSASVLAEFYANIYVWWQCIFFFFGEVGVDGSQT